MSPSLIGPPAPASLTGTLSGMDVLSQLLAAQEEQRKRLAESTARANEQAGQAQQQYQQAAAAPAPDVGAMQAFLPTLLGNVASVMSQNPTYQQNATQRLKEQRSTLLQSRADNLAQLRDAWKQKAEAAQNAGDLEAKLTAHAKIDTLDKTFEQILQQQRMDAASELQDKKNQAAMELQDKKNQAALDLQTKKDAAKDTAAKQQENVDFLTNEVKTTATGRTYLPLTNVKGTKMQAAALAFAKEQGLPALDPKTSARVDKLDVARQNTDDMINSLRTFLPKDANDIGTMTSNTYNNLRGTGNPEIRNWRTFYDALIGQLISLVGGEGTGVRITKAEIDRQIATAPTIRTPLPVAEKWVERTRRMMDNAERPIFGRTNLPSQAPATGKTVTLYKNGVPHDIPSDKVEDAIKNYGYARGPQ